VAAAFDEDEHVLTSCGGFRSIEEFEKFLDDDIRRRGLRLGRVMCNAIGMALVCGMNDEGRPVCYYLVVTAEQLPRGWRERMTAEDPPVAAFGLECGLDGMACGAYPVGAFASTSELRQSREFAESSVKGFDGKNTFALVVPFLIEHEVA